MSKKKYFFKTEKTPLIMPKKNTDNKRVIHYLTKIRCIDSSIIKNMIDENYIYQDIYGNCVFLGYTRGKKLKHISLVSSDSQKSFKIDVVGSDKQFSFSLIGNSKTVNVFESTIDLLSFMTLFKNDEEISNDGFVALGGIGRQALRRFIGENPYIEKIRICTDNDEAGDLAAKLIKKEFGNKYKIIRRKPHLKDFNEDLCYKKNDVEHSW